MLLVLPIFMDSLDNLTNLKNSDRNKKFAIPLCFAQV